MAATEPLTGATTATTATANFNSEAPLRVDGTDGKTVQDFVKGFKFNETASGKKYSSFVKNKHWENYKKEKGLAAEDPCVLVLTDTSGAVTSPDENRVRPLSFIHSCIIMHIRNPSYAS